MDNLLRRIKLKLNEAAKPAVRKAVFNEDTLEQLKEILQQAEDGLTKREVGLKVLEFIKNELPSHVVLADDIYREIGASSKHDFQKDFDLSGENFIPKPIVPGVYGVGLFG